MCFRFNGNALLLNTLSFYISRHLNKLRELHGLEILHSCMKVITWTNDTNRFSPFTFHLACHHSSCMLFWFKPGSDRSGLCRPFAPSQLFSHPDSFSLLLLFFSLQSFTTAKCFTASISVLFTCTSPWDHVMWDQNPCSMCMYEIREKNICEVSPYMCVMQHVFRISKGFKML